MLFGTDGVRDLATKILNENIAFKIGRATASLKKRAVIAVAFDTRLSGRAIAQQFTDGVIASGGRVIECGLLPTPALAYATKLSGADYGVEISASHNPPEYNGIKIFDGGGNKISLEEEALIEEIFDTGAYGGGAGTVCDGTKYKGDYINHITELIDCDFRGIKVTLDCCYGAAALIAPKIFRKLGAQVTALCNSYNGKLVNVLGGATNIDYLKNNMRGDIGFAFDGDADRVIGVTAEKTVIDGDCMLYFLSKSMLEEGRLEPKTVVGTKMTNMSLGEALEKRGVRLLKADVGDKYVLELMQKTGAVLGGEQSGHIIYKNYITTGDGILAAALMTKLFKKGVNFNEYRPYPQKLKNYRADRSLMKNDGFLAEIAEVEKNISGAGRILVRASGTEPLIRILIEGKNMEFVREISIITEKIMQKYSK